MLDYQTYYNSITKPFFAPPDWLFGLAWGIIYPLIIIAGTYLAFLVWRKQLPMKLLWIFLVNLGANLLFTPILLSGNALGATLDIFVVLGTLAYLEFAFWKKNKILFWLLLPFLLWGAFATVLQTAILFLN